VLPLHLLVSIGVLLPALVLLAEGFDVGKPGPGDDLSLHPFFFFV